MWGFGVASDWSAFGPTRFVTAGQEKIFDRLSAFALHPESRGEEAARLPASALRFPLFVQSPVDADSVVRTILSIDNEKERNDISFG
jgi:hypothetical protein